MSQDLCLQKNLNSREYKMILNLANFSAGEDAGMQAVWNRVATEANKLGLKVATTFKPAVKSRPVYFLDTAENELCSHRYVLRIRGSGKDVEATLKYRSEDPFITKFVDLRAKKYPSDCKYEEDIVPEFTSRYSRSNSIPGPFKAGTFATFGDLGKIFPSLTAADIAKNAALIKVRDFAVDESANKMEKAIQLAGKTKVAACFSLWHSIETKELLVAEFSFVYEMTRNGVNGEAALQARDLFCAIRDGLYEPNATTKTNFIYGASCFPKCPAV